MKKTICAAMAVLAMAADARAQLSSTEIARLAESAEVARAMHNTIPQDLWDKARCVAVIPNLKKAAFIIGGEYGKGVLSCRLADRWGAPMFLQLAKGSWGFQVGAEEVDVVMLVMNDKGMQKLLDNKVTLGADASVAAGPVGRRAGVGTDGALTAEILSYSRSKGLFAGIDLSGGILRPDEDGNARAYGATATPRSILASRELAAPPEASGFMSALNATSMPPQQAAQTPPRAAEPPPTTDTELRARLIAAQQAVERMIGDADRKPVGTSGGAAGTVTVNRAELDELRRELEAVLSALNGR